MKPKREITLGEMQDECSFRGGNCQTISCATVGGDMCVHYKICGKIGKPIDWDLTDPPRFTDAQMALLKALWEVGVLELDDDSEYDQVIMYTAHGRIGGFRNKGGIELSLKAGETLDLAELFGKECAK